MPNVADGSITNAVAADVDSTDTMLIVVDGALREITTAELAQIAELSSRYRPLEAVRTLDPRYVVGQAGVGTANRAIYGRLEGTKTGVTGMYIMVGTQSGNISLAVYPNNGSSSVDARPSGSRKATTGAIACPATGIQLVTFTASVDIAAGEWVCLTCDNTTATFARLNGPTGVGGAGVSYFEAAAHPAPSSVGALTAHSYIPWAST